MEYFQKLDVTGSLFSFDKNEHRRVVSQMEPTLFGLQGINPKTNQCSWSVICVDAHKKYAHPNVAGSFRWCTRQSAEYCEISYIDGLMQERGNSIANALKLRLSYTNPWICASSNDN